MVVEPYIARVVDPYRERGVVVPTVNPKLAVGVVVDWVEIKVVGAPKSCGAFMISPANKLAMLISKKNRLFEVTDRKAHRSEE